MLRRKSKATLLALARQFPAVLMLGPRQCGKTTLARTLRGVRYFDLEMPSDLQVFSGDIELALQQFALAPLVIDEAQTLPPLFPVLRAFIDASGRKRGRFFLLGSVSPELLKGISESLAGRVGVMELTPFLLCEVLRRKSVSLQSLWLRGGFPDALLAKDMQRWRSWQESYLRTFIERDVARHRLSVSSIEMRRLMTMIAHSHGGMLNASSLGRSLGYSYHTIQSLLDLLEGYFLVRRLAPYHANIGKRLVKAPKLYIRDSGLLHHLLGITSSDQLLTSPARGNSFEGFMIEQMIALETLKHPSSAFYFFRTQTGAEVDLVVDRGHRRFGYEFKSGVSVDAEDWKHLTAAIAAGVIQEGAVIYGGDRAFAPVAGISVVPAKKALSWKRR